MALFVISLRCNDLSAFGTKRTRYERQRIAGVSRRVCSLIDGAVLPFSDL